MGGQVYYGGAEKTNIEPALPAPIAGFRSESRLLAHRDRADPLPCP